jgi:hypothetical protein
MKVTAVEDLNNFTAELIGSNDYIQDVANFEGMEFVRLGNVLNTDRQGSIYMTADDAGAPYIDVVDGIDNHDD